MTYTKWLRVLIIGGIFLTLAIPFIVATGSINNLANILFPVMSFFPFITGKNFVFRIIVEIIFAMYVVLALRDPAYRPRSSYILWAVLLFTVWAGIATLASVDSIKSFWGNFERMEGYITVLHLAAYFLVVSAVMNTPKLWTRYLQASVIVSFFMSIYGIAQLVGWIPIDQGSARVDATLGNAIYFAVYMLFNIFFALYLAYRERREVVFMGMYAGIALLDTALLFTSETRGTILGLAGGVLIGAAYFWFAVRREGRMKKLRKAVGFAAIGFVVLGGVVFALRNQPFIKEIPGVGRVASINIQSGETATRLVIWNMAWEGFKEKPILGWGQENFSFVFNKYYDPKLWGQESWFDRAHNSYIDWALNAGALGFLLFVSLIGVGLWSVMRAEELDPAERAIFLGLLAAFAIHEIFVFDNIVSWMQFFAVLALMHGLVRRRAPAWFTKPLSNNGVAIAAPLIGIVAVWGLWNINAPGIASATTLLNALQPVKNAAGQEDPSYNLERFKSALATGALGRQEATEQLLQKAMSVNGSSSVAPELKQAYFDAGNQAIAALTTERPHDARLELFYGNFLNQFSQAVPALEKLQMALADSPRKQQIMFEVGIDGYLRQGKPAEALAILKQAYELDPTYDDALMYYAIALMYNGRQAEADKLLKDRFGTTEPDNNILLATYYQLKQYSRVENILKARLKTNPSDVNMWVQLAGVYYTAGDKAGAITTLEAAKAANPSSAAQIDPLIVQVRQGK